MVYGNNGYILIGIVIGIGLIVIMFELHDFIDSITRDKDDTKLRFNKNADGDYVLSPDEYEKSELSLLDLQLAIYRIKNGETCESVSDDFPITKDTLSVIFKSDELRETFLYEDENHPFSV